MLKRIEEIYHQNHGNPGYRMMHDYLNLEGIYVSKSTVYRYMKELGIEAIINKKKPLYIKGKAHKIFG
ncbi:IS3 family transposase, partial [Sebaldella sp. S0638]|uniref:IS3 family transposase n=1 Tax=Sebaldella sp. S0638 TaxID=2957809 RepID=UPI0035322C1A